MTDSLAGKRVFVTGVASGIGRAAALRLAREGAKLYLTDIDADGLERTVADARAGRRGSRTPGTAHLRLRRGGAVRR